jgi:hypothetical protein
LLQKISKVYTVTNKESGWINEVPKQVKQIAERFTLDIVPNGGGVLSKWKTWMPNRGAGIE